MRLSECGARWKGPRTLSIISRLRGLLGLPNHRASHRSRRCLFGQLRSNTDSAARKLAVEMMDSVDTLEIPEVEFTAMEDEIGSDLTSGRQTHRLSQGGTSPSVAEKASK